jgi:hypothetical protein
VPPSPNRTRLTREDPALAEWRTKSAFLARGARARAHWDVPTKVDPPAPRWVSITLYRWRRLDDDHAWASVTPVLNGLKGALILDDSGPWCRLWRVEQINPGQQWPERTSVTVSLVAPEAAGG